MLENGLRAPESLGVDRNRHEPSLAPFPTAHNPAPIFCSHDAAKGPLACSKDLQSAFAPGALPSHPPRDAHNAGHRWIQA